MPREESAMQGSATGHTRTGYVAIQPLDRTRATQPSWPTQSPPDSRRSLTRGLGRTSRSRQQPENTTLRCRTRQAVRRPRTLAGLASRSAHVKCGIERLKQRRVAERLEQALHGTLFQRAWTDGLVCQGRDEDDRGLLPDCSGVMCTAASEPEMDHDRFAMRAGRSSTRKLGGFRAASSTVSDTAFSGVMM
jgi:hypothetical protein